MSDQDKIAKLEASVNALNDLVMALFKLLEGTPTVGQQKMFNLSTQRYALEEAIRQMRKQ